MARDRVFVVGHRGMLGNDVARWFREQGSEVVTSVARFDGLDEDSLIADVAAASCPIIVNCAAALPGRAGGGSQWLANALLPIRLASILDREQLLIHASTDGVFTGKDGPYGHDDAPDARDTYGLSKWAGEWAVRAPGVVVIRTSILGETGGLLGWLLQQTGEVDGFVNHIWSGVTTLEWARRCSDIASARDRRSRIEHLASPPISKFDLLLAAARAYEHPVRILEATAPAAINRTLIPTIATVSISAQLGDLRRWRSA